MALDQEAGLVGIGTFLALLDGPAGHIRLRSARPDDPPLIHHGFLETVEAGAFDGVVADIGRLLETDALRSVGAHDVDAGIDIRERLRHGVSTGTHPAGGCSIGMVVGSELELLGLDGLTVADASVFPRHISNNPNLTIHAIGERAAMFISGRPSTSPRPAVS